MSGPRLTAVLGPTNTGKTHLAVERMLGYRGGMIGLPLRLLAREVYDRVARQVGRGAVALVTGEERIVPAGARYFVCTVESMPVNRAVAFLAIDEVQLAADPERGHVFTDRILNARGLEETMFLGADTMRPLLRRLVPGANFVSRPRFSRLSHAGPKKLARLPPRTAVVAFSAADVYAMGEILRRKRGGAAVVLGALSPRTRNAQVAMYQAGEVDYLVATDAIGMGLNMDVNLVAFTELRKFDGQGVRDLTLAELAQIAGRAGRHLNDGRFATTADAGVLSPETVAAVENHRFARLRGVYWRNDRLRLTSLRALIRSLEEPPPSRGLARAPPADDYRALCDLTGDAEIAGRAATPDGVRLLWEVCRIPDFRKVLGDSHVRLLGRIFRYLADGDGQLPLDWVGRHVSRLDRTDGDIDTLMTRIAHIRTWTYVSHRSGWLPDAPSWRQRTREIEDRLSDALHDRLTQRFVDRRTALLMRRGKDGDVLSAEVADDGSVTVEGHYVGRLEGFQFFPDASAGHGQLLLNTARRALAPEIGARVNRLLDDRAKSFAIDNGARLRWHGEPVARLTAGAEVLAPKIDLPSSELLSGAARARVQERLAAWLGGEIRVRAGPLLRARAAALSGPARGLVFQLTEALGTIPRRQVSPQLRALTEADRQTLAGLGVRLGRETVFFPSMLKGARPAFRALLWAVHDERRQVPSTPPPGSGSAALDKPAAFYEAIGYRAVGPRAIRVDILERLSARLRREARRGGITAGAELAALCGCRSAELDAILWALGYRPVAAAEGKPARYVVRRRTAAKNKAPRRQPPGDPDSPFAELACLRR